MIASLPCTNVAAKTPKRTKTTAIIPIIALTTRPTTIDIAKILKRPVKS